MRRNWKSKSKNYKREFKWQLKIKRRGNKSILIINSMELDRIWCHQIWMKVSIFIKTGQNQLMIKAEDTVIKWIVLLSITNSMKMRRKFNDVSKSLNQSSQKLQTKRIRNSRKVLKNFQWAINKSKWYSMSSSSKAKRKITEVWRVCWIGHLTTRRRVERELRKTRNIERWDINICIRKRSNRSLDLVLLITVYKREYQVLKGIDNRRRKY